VALTRGTVAQIPWSARDPFAHTLVALFDSLDEPGIEVLQDNLAVVHGTGQVFVVIRYVEELQHRLAELVAGLVGQGAAGPRLELALIGGGADAEQLLTKAQPGRASMRIFHLPEHDNELAPPVRVLGRGRSTLELALNRARQRMGQPIDAGQAQSAAEAAHARFVVQAREQQRFSELLSSRKPRATYAILGLIAATFALQLASGSTTSMRRLIDMGALVGPLVAQGEWWRLASSSLLHGGVMHVAFNTYVLFALGSMLERLLGTARFLVLYVVSGVAAALGSTLFIGGVSVGASGAIWGLLGAEAALAFGPSTILPGSVRRSAQRATLINLGINTVASFIPHVDWAAHFTGGAAGALLILTGIFIPQAKATKSAVWTGVAAVLATLFFGAAIFGVLGALR